MQCEDFFFASALLSVVVMLFLSNAGFLSLGSIPDESKALSLLAPANAVAGILPGGGLLPTPNPMSNPVRFETL